MKNELTYVGPDSMGPHYTESGKRPLMGEYKSAHVIVQEGDGNVLAAHYDGTNDRFSTYFADHTIRPVCWWHLPAAAPITEREWWMAQEWKQEFWWEWGTDRHLYRFQRYFWEDTLQLAASSFITHCDTIEAAKEAAYDHWVAAGRP